MTASRISVGVSASIVSGTELKKASVAGEEYENEEDRIEAICRRERIEAVVEAIVSAHPYETPAIAIYPTLTGEYRYWKD